MSKEWSGSFLAFLADMGPRPSRGHTLERVDNDKGYEKGNCVWATREQQTRNRRNTLTTLLKGEMVPLSVVVEAAAAIGVSRRTVERRHQLGWAAEKIINTPTLRPGEGRSRSSKGKYA